MTAIQQAERQRGSAPQHGEITRAGTIVADDWSAARIVLPCAGSRRTIWISTNPIRCSVGVTAYNEAANIGRLLDALLTQQLHDVQITEIIVVASGCTDDTVPIAESYVAREPQIRLSIQPRREGKTAAINVFLAHAREDICVLESGDTLPAEDAVENLVRMFRGPVIGMTGAHKIPVNTPDHMVGFFTHLRLRMEHQLCLDIPHFKIGDAETRVLIGEDCGK